MARFGATCIFTWVGDLAIDDLFLNGKSFQNGECFRGNIMGQVATTPPGNQTLQWKNMDDCSNEHHL